MTEIIKGNLKDVDFFDLVDLLSKAKYTGRLTFKTEDDEGEIFFDKGFLKAAKCSSKEGFEALLKMSSFEDGDFRFEDKITCEEQHFFDDTAIILDRVKEIESIKLAAGSEAKDKTIKLIPKKQEVSLGPVDWMVIALSQNFLSLEEIAAEIGVDINTILDIVNRLKDLGILELKERKSAGTKEDKKVPSMFWDSLKSELSCIIGPVAEAIIEDEVKFLGGRKEDFSADKLPDLVESLSEEIEDPQKRLDFQKKMLDLLKRL